MHDIDPVLSERLFSYPILYQPAVLVGAVIAAVLQ